MEDSLMDSKQWPALSQTKMVGLILLILALALFLSLMVLVSQKSFKKKAVTTIPPASPIIQNSPIPDPTKDWRLISEKDFSLKVPPKAMTVENIKQASESAWLKVILNPQEATQAGLVVEVSKKNTSASSDKQLYLINSENPNIRMITKPIDILIGGFKGYEFYLEGSEVKGYFGSSSFKKGKIRIIEFSTNDKHYVLIGSLDPQIETILSTITIK